MGKNMINKDWHFPRLSLAKQVIGMFESGLSTSLVFFAPRRMGKTEFLLKDIQPLALKDGWLVFYHSFLDVSKDAEIEFAAALKKHLLDKSMVSKAKSAINKVGKISGAVSGLQASVELHDDEGDRIDFREILTKLTKHHKVLLLMDEIQALTKNDKNLPFITSLRTVLDTNKDNIKVIFTGSSREGLKRMFSTKEAPFFHFGQNLSFPQFGPEFTDHLSRKYSEVTQKKLDERELWNVFEELGRVPQLIRSLVERIILHPKLSISKAKEGLLEELVQDRSFDTLWDRISSLEQLILLEIASSSQRLYSAEVRGRMAAKLGLNDVPVHSIQSAVRKLNKNTIIGHLPEHGEYFIDDPNFQAWMLQK